jgi:hypothetical protein
VLVAAGGDPPQAAIRLANARTDAIRGFFISLLNFPLFVSSVAGGSDRLVLRGVRGVRSL